MAAPAKAKGSSAQRAPISVESDQRYKESVSSELRKAKEWNEDWGFLVPHQENLLEKVSILNMRSMDSDDC